MGQRPTRSTRTHTLFPCTTLFRSQMPICYEIARFEMLAAADAELQRVDAGADRGQGARASARAAFAGGGEAVIIGPVGFEARDLDMDAVAQFGMRSEERRGGLEGVRTCRTRR